MPAGAGARRAIGRRRRSPPRAGGADGPDAAAPRRRPPWRRCAHSRGNSAQNTRAQVSASASARCVTPTSMPSDSASAAKRRWRASGCSLRASATVHRTGGSGHARPARSKAWRSTRRSKPALWATSTRPAHRGGQLGQRRLGGRRLVDHRLGDPGEALDAAREGCAHGHERLPAIVQLAAADQHGADLRELAGVAGQAVGLGVDGEELGGAQGLVEKHRTPGGVRLPPDGVQQLPHPARGGTA